MTMIRTKLGNPQKNLVDRIKAFQKSDKANRHCADCGELGPTYICTDFGTFVCTECAGIHRELNHKVKGISVSKWTEQDVENLEAHGNTKDRETYMANYRPGIDLAEPNNQDRQRLRDFMKLKYVDKRWAGTPPDRSVRTPAVASDSRAKQSPMSPANNSQPDLIDAAIIPDHEQSSVRPKHHKHKKAAAPEVGSAVASGDLLDDDWGFQSAGGPSTQNSIPPVQQNGNSGGLLSFSPTPAGQGSATQAGYSTLAPLPNAQASGAAVATQQPSLVTPLNYAQPQPAPMNPGAPGASVPSLKPEAAHNIPASMTNTDLESTIRVQCTSLLNSLRQLHTVDPAMSETAKRFIEDSLRGLGIEWMSGSYSSSPVVSSTTVPAINSAAPGAYPMPASNPAVSATGHMRSDSNPFGAMQPSSPRAPPQVSMPRTNSLDRKDNNPFGEIASLPQSSLQGNLAASGIGPGGVAASTGVHPPAQLPVSPGGMNNLLGGFSPARAGQPARSSGPVVGTQQAQQNPFVFH
ncbi:hypothetical protein FOZ62_024066 [Perkinsus olseni]|uniref:Arf-GAP domain-containing protein n=2 Tax=Perkinsus olseni TaxID=32597 RepID=A0A7J6QSU5_PEROL|nr:hypothetical protein FOZ62_024066 [Perkinsus olseni]